MVSPVIYQPTSSKSGILHDKMLPDKKTLNKMIENEKSLDEKAFLPDKRFLRKVSPTSEALVELLDRVDSLVINQKVEGMFNLGCCKVKNVFREKKS